METFKDILWPIIVLGGFGAFIDFLIGKAGQQKTKDFLLKWWVRFDDVRWNNFGREEGLFAGRLMERWFGKRIWSPRRIFVAFALFNLLLWPNIYEVCYRQNPFGACIVAGNIYMGQWRCSLLL